MTDSGAQRDGGWRCVVCATDLSSDGDAAVAAAVAIARRDGAELHLLHALPVELAPGASTDLPAAVLVPMDEAAALAPEWAAKLHVELAAVPVYAEIVNVAEKLGADLIVVGSRGASGLRRVLGTTAEKVTRYAHAAVLVVREGATLRSGPVLAATDLSDPAVPAIRAGAAEALRRQAPLVVVHCFDTPPETLASVSPQASDLRTVVRSAAEERLRHAALTVAPQADLRLVDGPAAQALTALAADVEAALLVVGTRGRTGLKRMLLGSTAEHVLRHAPCSILVVRLHPSGAGA